MKVLPGQTIGILGSGQLARMLCLDARRMGYRTVVWSGGGNADPTRNVADELIEAAFDDESAFATFTELADVATVEFENIPSAALRAVEGKMPLRPSAHCVETSQNRAREKTFLRDVGAECAPFALVNTLDELKAAYAKIGPDGVLKTAESGYDGKGQVRLRDASELDAAWESINGQPAVLEGFIDFDCEASILIARSPEGEMTTYPVSENEHRDHILDLSIVPARVSDEVARQCRELAEKIAVGLDYVGLLAVEYFITADGRAIVNEIAPRPHNSGHFTMDASCTSQFEQQLRAVCGVALGSNELLSPVVMLNLLGDMWDESGECEYESVLATAGAKLHLYGKGEADGRRKMGHVNVLAGQLEAALAKATGLKESLLA